MFGIPEIENVVLRYIAGYSLVILGGFTLMGIIWCIGTFIERIFGINLPIDEYIAKRERDFENND